MEGSSINDIVKAFVEQYRQSLSPSKASGKLESSVSGFLEVEGTTYSVVLRLEDYWKYVEKGRKAGGKFPPIDKIREWIRVKPVLPRPYNGKLPTEKQLAFLIARKIAVKGIEPTNYLSDTIKSFKLEEKLIKAIFEEIDSKVDDLF